MSKRLIVNILFCMILLSFELYPIEFSGTVLYDGNQNEIGWMSQEGVNSKIIGVVDNLVNLPDIFVQSDSLYPGIFKYNFQGRDEFGTPVFGGKIRVKVPFDEKVIFNTGIVKLSDQSVHLIWLSDNRIFDAIYNKDTNEFTQNSSYSFPLFSHNPASLSAYVDENGKLIIIISVPVELTKLPPGDPLSPNYIPYQLTGVWRGSMRKERLYKIVYNTLGNNPDTVQQITPPGLEFLMGVPGCSSINYDGNTAAAAVICGSYFGIIYYLKKQSNQFYRRIECVDRKGNFIRNPNMGVAPVAYPNESGQRCDILAAGRGVIYYYKYSGESDISGKPIYEDPLPLKEHKPFLYSGSMPAPNVIDIDGDGMLDIISGNAEGYIVYHKNLGTNENPRFNHGEYLKSNNRILLIEPGYSESPMGPIAARLGYAGPNLIDWDNDGIVDMLINDARGKHSFYKGKYVGDEFQFQREKPLYLHGLALRGTQRCRPGVGVLDGKMAYVTLDDDDEFRIYWKIDNQNLEDGGNLKMYDGSNISANKFSSFGTGRVRFDLVDWDNDGVKDILLGVDKWHSIPNNSNGLPANGQYPSATILFMKNVGTEAAPSFAFPEAIKFRSQDIKLGINVAGVVACELGQILNGSPNLLITDERGRFYLVTQGNMNPNCPIPEDLPGNLIDNVASSISKDFFSSSSVVSFGSNIYVAYDFKNKTIIKKSNDNGITWQKTAELDYGKNGTLFVSNNQLYLIGSSHSADNCVISRSEDNGYTWTIPNSPLNGLLLTSTSTNIVKTTSTPVSFFNNRVYKSIEQVDVNGKRRIGFMSASVDNLMTRTSWISTNYVEFDASLSNTGVSWQDGRVLLTKQGNMINLVSVKGGDGNTVAIINIEADNKTAVYDINKGPVSIPGGSKDFTIKYDIVSEKYWAITHNIKDYEEIKSVSPDLTYNTMSLFSSPDLVNWTMEREVFYTTNYNQGFLFNNWLIVNNNIIGISCVAWDDCEGSVSNILNPNYIISFEIPDFRN